MAFDGDVRTAWRVGGADPTGEHLTLEVSTPSPPTASCWSSRRTVRAIAGSRRSGSGSTTSAPVDVDPRPVVADARRAGGALAGDGGGACRPRDPRGHRVPPFDPGLANAVGFAEVRVGDVVVTE